MRTATRRALGAASVLCLVGAAGCRADAPGAGGSGAATLSPAPSASGAGPGSSGALPPVPRLLTVRDDGRSYATRVGARLALSLAERYAVAGLEVSGAPVDVAEDVPDARSGQRTWQLRPRAAGLAVVRAGAFSVQLHVSG